MTTALTEAKMSRLQGASGIHVGTMGYGKMEGSADDRAIAYVIERDEYQGAKRVGWGREQG